MGQAAGSAAITFTGRPPAATSPRNGKASPEKLEPPPTQPTTTSGSAPACASCSRASWPITVWCSSTWFSTLPSAYLVSSWVAASSTASLIAMPRLPVVSGSRSRIVPAGVGLGEGLATQVAPQTCISDLRYGFASNEARTM